MHAHVHHVLHIDSTTKLRRRAMATVLLEWSSHSRVESFEKSESSKNDGLRRAVETTLRDVLRVVPHRSF